MAYEKNQITLLSNGLASRDFIYFGVVSKLVKLDAKNETYNLSSGKSFTLLHLAHIVKNVYQARYNRSINININVNTEDCSKSNELLVSNAKICELLDIKFSESFEKVINDIFDLLETK